MKSKRYGIVAAGLVSAILLITAASSQAATYVLKQDGFKGTFKTHPNNRKVEFEAKLRTRCSTGRVSPTEFHFIGGSAFKFDRHGVFLSHHRWSGDDGNDLYAIRGRIRSGTIRGVIWDVGDSSPPPERCWSGKSTANPKVRFVAKRVAAGK